MLAKKKGMVVRTISPFRRDVLWAKIDKKGDIETIKKSKKQ
jgi:hypothetical protein